MLLPLHLPRRHRRPLLFPPGLLALAWLLWLGCVALPQEMSKRPQEYVTRFTMPELLSFYKHQPLRPIWPPYFSSLELAAFRPWQNIYFTGNLWQDYFSYQQTRLAVNRLQEDTLYQAGIRLQFESSANYKSLVFSIDQLTKQDIKRYWLDIQHQPIILYAITNLPTEIDATESNPRVFICGTPDNEAEWHPPFVSASFAEFITPDWRNSTLLLLLMALLSAVRLGRQWLG